MESSELELCLPQRKIKQNLLQVQLNQGQVRLRLQQQQVHPHHHFSLKEISRVTSNTARALEQSNREATNAANAAAALRPTNA
ncbi:MAG: hypothetical protein WBL67_10410 [Nitrososphaeraceae archaeon]